MTLAERSGSFLRVVGRGRGRRAAHGFVVVALLAVLVPWVAWPAPSQAAMAAPTVQTLPDADAASMVRGTNGNPIIAYFSQGPPRETWIGDTETTHLLTVLFCGDLTCTAGNTVTPEQTPRLRGMDTDITIDSAGNPVVVFSTVDDYGGSRGQNYVDPRLELLRCSDPACSGGSISLVDPPTSTLPPVYTGLEVEVGANDVPTIFTNINSSEEGYILPAGSGIVSCLDPACSQPAMPVNFEATIYDVAIPNNGNPILAMGGTALVFCLDTGCSSTQLTPLAPGLDGAISTIELRDDVPILMSDTGELVNCADAACTQHEVQLIDHSIIVGLDIMLTADGFPVLAYTVREQKLMRVVECQSSDCAIRSYATFDKAYVHDMYMNSLGQPTFLAQTPNGTHQLTTCSSSPCNAPTTMCQGFPVTADLNDPNAKLYVYYINVINGTDGDDVIDLRSWQGRDGLICANDGNDTIYSGHGSDSILGGAGDDTIFGGADDDIVIGGPGDDEIFGEDGNDTLHGNRGNDQLSGDAGDDRIFGYADDDIIFGGDGDDRLHGNFGEDQIFGNSGDDRIFGYGDNDILNGGPGNDIISGNRGDDAINGGDGNDILYGSDGKDIVNGGPGNDNVQGNAESDVVNGGDGDDQLDGGIFHDECNGGDGTDTATRCEIITGVP